MMKRTGGEREPLLPAARELSRKLRAAIGEPHAVHDADDRFTPVRHVVHARDEVEVFKNRQVLIEAELLRHVAGLAADRRGFTDDAMSKARTAPAIGDEKSAQHPLGDEKPQEDIFGREQRHDRRARWDGLAGAGKDVVDDSSHWRGDVALVEPPLYHGHRRARRIDRRTLRGNLLIPGKRRTHLRECRFEPVNLGFRRAVIGTKLIETFWIETARRRTSASFRWRSAWARTSVAWASARSASACSISVGLPPAWKFASCASAYANCRAAWSTAIAP